MEFNREEPVLQGENFVAQILLSTCLTVSVIAGIFSAMQIDIPYGGLFLTALIGSAWMSCINFFPANRQNLLKACSLVFPIFVAGIFWKWTKAGTAIICNRILMLIGAAKGEIQMPFALNEEIPEQTAVLAVAICLTLWMAYLAASVYREFHPVVLSSIVVGMLLLNGLFSQQETGLWLAMTMVCMGCIIAKFNLHKKKLMLPMMTLLLGITVIIGVIGAGFSQSIDPWKASITAAVRHQLTSKIDVQRYGGDEQRAMPMGDFSDLDDLVFSDAVMLKISGDEYESQYLRGFVGGAFDGKKWSPIEGEKLYEQAESFYWLHDDGYYGQNLLAKTAQILDQKGTKSTLSFTIENVGADSRVLYAPYEVISIAANGESLLQQTMLEEDSFWADGWSGVRSYEIKTLENQVKRYPELISALIDQLKKNKLQDFRRAESHYNQFVYENYTALTESEAKLLQKYLGETEIKEGLHLEYEAAKKNILQCLKENVIYAEKLLKEQSAEHVVEEFLQVDKAGYSVHYATTAALMFRYYGIPARYVEGYLITPDAVKAAKGEKQLLVTDKDAHAWVEYYQDGIGWIPFEVTPPYMDVMEQPESLHSANGSEDFNESSQTGLGMEMIEDNYEPEDLEPEKEESRIPWKQILLSIWIILLAVLAVIAGRHFYLRKQKINQRRKAFAQDDRSEAVKALFGHILTLHQALGIEKKNCSVFAYEKEVSEKMGEERGEAYEEIARIYQKAAYSQSSVTEDEYMKMYTYMDALLEALKVHCSWRKRAVMKWVKGLY